jgi:hypothetical protein
LHREENAYMERIDTSSKGTEPKYNPETNGKAKKAQTRKEKERNSRVLEKGGR